MSYEQREEMQNLARKNINRTGLASRVDFKLRDIQEGFDETDADAFFLDVPNPYDYIATGPRRPKTGRLLLQHCPYRQSGGNRCCDALRRHRFAFLEMCESFTEILQTGTGPFTSHR